MSTEAVAVLDVQEDAKVSVGGLAWMRMKIAAELKRTFPEEGREYWDLKIAAIAKRAGREEMETLRKICEVLGVDVPTLDQTESADVAEAFSDCVE